ncbi:hypothetical protein Avbf_18862 [Armadillidium vulgare]|nr:hypothetical protein Avbf_18862 [Armadillidium vulgare]
MMHWLNSPHKESTDGLQAEEQVTHVTRVEANPEQSRTHLNKGDLSDDNVETQEYKGGGRSDFGKKTKVLSTFNEEITEKHKENSDTLPDRHNRHNRHDRHNRHNRHDRHDRHDRHNRH